MNELRQSWWKLRADLASEGKRLKFSKTRIWMGLPQVLLPTNDLQSRRNTHLGYPLSKVFARDLTRHRHQDSPISTTVLTEKMSRNREAAENGRVVHHWHIPVKISLLSDRVRRVRREDRRE